MQAVGDGGIAVAAAGIQSVTSGGFGVTVQADADPDAEISERLQHWAAQQGAVSLHREVDLG